MRGVQHNMVCVCARVRACVRARACVCVYVRVCVRALCIYNMGLDARNPDFVAYEPQRHRPAWSAVLLFSI